MNQLQKDRLARLEKLVFQSTPSDISLKKCKAFSKKTAMDMLCLLEQRLAEFCRENPSVL